MIRSTVVLTLALCALAAPAQAGTLTRSGSTVTFTAAPGEENRPILGAGQVGVSVNDAYTVDPGPGCWIDKDSGSAVCPGDGVTRLVVLLGDEHDVVQTYVEANVRFPDWLTLVIDGGAGDDEVFGSEHDGDELSGGAGNDRVNGGGGKDIISGGAGKDRLTGFGRITGGDGDDFIELFDSLRDRWYGSRVSAGAGNDRVLTGNRKHDVVDCGPGRDRATTTDYPSVQRRYRFKADTFRGCKP